MTTPSQKPIEKIPAKDMKVKWSDVFEIRVPLGASSEIEAFRARVIKALDHLQSHQFQGPGKEMLDGQKMMQEAAGYLDSEKAIKMNSAHVTPQQKSLVPKVKFLIELHDEPHNPKKSRTVIKTYPDHHGNHLLGIDIGLNDLKKVHDYDGPTTKLSPKVVELLKCSQLEMLLASQISQFAKGEINETVAKHYRNIVFEALREDSLQKIKEPQKPATTKPKAKPQSPSRSSQPSKSSPGKTMMAELVSPEDFPDYHPEAKAEIVMQTAGQKPQLEVVKA